MTLQIYGIHTLLIIKIHEFDAIFTEEIQINVKNPDAYKLFFNQVIDSFSQIKLL